LVKEWHDQRMEDKLNSATVEMELKAMEKKLWTYNVEQLGDIPVKREDKTMRIMVCQMGGCVSKESREFKIAAMKRLNRKCNIDLCVFMELNFDWRTVNSSANLASWFHKEERDLRLVTSHNTQEIDQVFGKHQTGGTGMVCQHEFLQYARTPSRDPRGLGRWCLWPFYCNPSHMTRIVASYQPCISKVRGLKTVYQQQICYIQSRGLPLNLIELFVSDLSKQIKEWRMSGERILLLIYINRHPLQNKLYDRFKAEQTEMEEFSHKCWGPKEPYMHTRGKYPIDGAYKTPEVEIVNLSMLTFAESPGDHRSLLFDISTHSLLGEHKYKVCRPVSRRLVTSQPSSVKPYNKIVREQFEIHCIVERMDAVNKMARY
jgi:hypothetical protein